MAHLINSLKIRTQPPMHAEHPPIHDGPQSEVVKHFAAPPPDVRGAVLALAFVVEAVDLGGAVSAVLGGRKTRSNARRRNGDASQRTRLNRWAEGMEEKQEEYTPA